MAMKKKVKIKKKNFTIFILLVILIILIIYKGTTKIYEAVKEKNKPSIEKRVQEESPLGSASKLSYYKKSLESRYINYKKKNKNLSNEDVVLQVNIGLDNPFYTNTKETPNLNKNTILVNKYYYLPDHYEPKNLEVLSTEYSRSGMKLVSEAKSQFEAMAKAAKKEDLKLVVTSSYRDYDYQVKLYDNYVAQDGKEKADKYSARPGYSEHQTGLAVDLYNGKEVYTNFHKTKEFTWMQKNAHKYGFILRFPEDKENLTGYEYESWHYRYVGEKIATYIHENNLCLEEYYAMYIEK